MKIGLIDVDSHNFPSLALMKAERNCYSCAHFSELKEPREREGGVAIYGYCFKDGVKDSSPRMGKGCPVYVPSGTCKSWEKRVDGSR